MMWLVGNHWGSEHKEEQFTKRLILIEIIVTLLKYLNLHHILLLKIQKMMRTLFPFVPVDPNLALRRGARPIIISCKDRSEECSEILKIVKQFLEGKVSQNDKTITITPAEIAILYRRKPLKDDDIFKKFLNELDQVTPLTWLSEDYYSRFKVFDRSTKIQTVASSKGLQYRLVIIMWADLFEPHTSSDVEMEQRLLYVALTRASDFLIITYSKPNALIESIIASGDIVFKQISTKEEKIEPKNEEVLQKTRSHSQETIRIKYPNAYVKWSSDDDERLRELYKSGKTVKELIQIFQRKRGAIESRLKKLKLKE